jgi:hypothetical protein
MKATAYQWDIPDKDGDRVLFTVGVIPQIGDCFMTAAYMDFETWIWNDIVPGMTPKMVYDMVKILGSTVPPEYYAKLQADYNLAQALKKG